MNDVDKSKAQLIAELQGLRAHLARLEGASLGDSAVTEAMGSTTALRAVAAATHADGVSLSQPPLAHGQLAAALHACEARLAEVQRVANLGYYSYDIVHDIIDFSAALRDILGIAADHPTDAAGWLVIVHPAQRTMMAAYLATLLQQRQHFDKEYQITHGKSGQIRWVHGLGQLRVDGEGRPVELFGTIQDITARKMAEDALVQSEATYRTLIDGMKETVWVVDGDGKFIDVNRTASALLHYSREELLTMGPRDIDVNITEAMIKQGQSILAQNRIRIFETAHIRKDGERIPVEIQSTRVTYQGREVILSIARDITARKQAEVALQRSEAANRLLAAVVRQAGEAIVITDLTGTIEYVNPAYEAMSGYPAEAMVGQRLPLLQHEAVDTAQRTPWPAVQQNETWTGRPLAQRKDGSSYHTEVTLFPIHDVEGQIINYCQIARDISHELELERHLNQSQRLETIGTLAGGIAHDFNNILTPIMGYTELVASKLPATDPLQSNLQQILKSAQRARVLVVQILTFSRQHEQQRRPLYLQHVIRDVLKFMRPTLPSTIAIRQLIDPACQQVLADAAQLHQVLVNLCTNAFHAMEANGGLLTITLEQVVIDPALIQRYPILQQKPYARLTVSDTGSGMASATLERIFEPFFTTKPVDRGTGLGLSVAHGIVRAHDGALLVQSELGQGASFQIYLPVLADDVALGGAAGTPAVRGQELILLVDDEPTITALLTELLEWQGYQVEAYNSSREALSAFRQSPHKFDLVLSDLTMPDMTGVELAGQLQQVRAGIPIIIITGYGNHLDEKTQKSHGIRHVIGKPIGIAELAPLIRQVLDT